MPRSQEDRLRLRLRNVAHLRRMLTAYPGGLVPVSTAARIMGHKDSTIIRRLNARGTLPFVPAIPDARRANDFLVPLDDLLMHMYQTPGLRADYAMRRCRLQVYEETNSDGVARLRDVDNSLVYPLSANPVKKSRPHRKRKG